MKEFDFSQNWWQFLILAVVCYFIGCFNFARTISHFKKRDIEKIGSGNPGTMNMTREFGLKIGVITFLCDACKGGVPAMISYFIYRDYRFAGTWVQVSDVTRYFCGLFVIIGHIFPVTMRFKGGKGIASTMGMFWFALSCENAWWILLGFGVAVFLVSFIYFTEWGSLGSLFGVTTFSVIQMCIFLYKYGIGVFNAYTVCLYMIILAINVLTWCAHHANIVRLFAGEEHHTSIRKLSKKKKKA
jgi:glycerol-3-phosphate acyltransferase PlsY